MKKRLDFIREYFTFLTVIAFFVILSTAVLAQTEPVGPDTITIAGSGRHTNNSAPITIQAQAGNVTALVIASVRATQAWQGYYGNLTGTIVLDDANNNTLYDWSLPNPSGEVYASNGSIVTWSDIYCMNISPLGPTFNRTNGNTGALNFQYSINGSQIELNFGINATDKDGLNETFNDTYTDATGFRVGATRIDVNDGCSLAHPYTSQAYDSSQWQELLLSDNASLVFTSLVRENANGFEAGSTDTYDFQMLVLENGHVGQGGPNQLTSYYFFVELT